MVTEHTNNVVSITGERFMQTLDFRKNQDIIGVYVGEKCIGNITNVDDELRYMPVMGIGDHTSDHLLVIANMMTQRSLDAAQ
jgi:hypothetical protein